MQIVFINYGKYCVSSGVHIHFIANVLRDMGHDCTVVLPTVEDSCYFGTPDYTRLRDPVKILKIRIKMIIRTEKIRIRTDS